MKNLGRVFCRKQCVVAVLLLATFYLGMNIVTIEIYVKKNLSFKKSIKYNVTNDKTQTFSDQVESESYADSNIHDVNLNSTSLSFEHTTSASRTADIPCPDESPLLKGPVGVNFEGAGKNDSNWPPTFEEIAAAYPTLENGGYYPGPNDCRTENTLAIIIPFRDREEHLRFFLYYIHGILQRQQARYRIFVVEQDDDQIFNKGQLMNTGFIYAHNDTTLHPKCFFFHDVDTVSEDDRTLYRCRGGNEVLHLSHRIDKFNYEFCCGMTVGGVIGMTNEQFQNINGFSNAYYGWGAEDDDINARIIWIGRFSIHRPPDDYIRFKMIRHESDKKNPENNERLSLLNSWKERQSKDGLNSLQSTITSVVEYPTHTRILVNPKPK
ncbi:beta-1,4-galactosyltransferase 1-like [Clavelina lepadiformis]|uniref:beta-1,4-galactosyltransferase 1-like n=1 Tax=Clavelina lepadiformis TaxID=159417 RepID=UPI00404156E2